jgi:hypothetical protein
MCFDLDLTANTSEQLQKQKQPFRRVPAKTIPIMLAARNRNDHDHLWS